MDEAPADSLGAEAFAAARTMVGVRFRLQGFDPATGLDCAGLIWAAYAAAGRTLIRPRGYPMRGWAGPQIETGLRTAGFGPVQRSAHDGDIALIVYPAGQFHLAILGRASLVHAHAGLRKVVETPLDGTLHDAARWRLVPGRFPDR